MNLVEAAHGLRHGERPAGGRLEPTSQGTTGEPSAPQAFASRGEAVPCANFDDPPETCYEDHTVTVPAGAGTDNARATIRVEWATPASDYDMKVYRPGGTEPVAADGTIRGARQVGIARGERRALDLRSSCARRD